MKNFEWILKNWDKEYRSETYFNTKTTISELFADIQTTRICKFIPKKVCNNYNYCLDCIKNWLESEANEENNLFYNKI